MKVTLFHCGPAANESELMAFEHIRSRLQSTQGDDEWVLLTNLTFSVTHQLQSDEIDIVAIGPAGVRVLEVKHWTPQWVDTHADLVAHEAERVTNKARKIGTTLRRTVRELPRVDGVIFLTQESVKVKRLANKEVRGVQFHALADWKSAIGFDTQRLLSSQQIRTLSRVLEPKIAVAMDGSMRRLAGYVNLELQTPKEERFHRIYKGIHPGRQDRVVLHLYDLSASDDKNAEARAKREFEALHRLQLHAWAPRILDSYQDAPGYAGEMFFFTVVDPAAPGIDKRASDSTWDTTSRLVFARSAVCALIDLHNAGTSDELIVHRNLTTQTILVKHDSSAILTGFDRSKIPSDVSVAASATIAGDCDWAVPPEVRAQGLAVADHRSDIYSLSTCLLTLFQGRDDVSSQHAVKILKAGMEEKPEDRITLQSLRESLSNLLGESTPLPATPPARFWTEEQAVRFHERDYRIVARLGSGGVGTTFKVVEVDRTTKEDLGTYVAKVGHSEERGASILRAYSFARSHLGRHTGLSAIFEVARDWRENDFIALMTWIEGAPLGDLTGVFPLLAEEQQEDPNALALRWLRSMCDALDVLHRNGLIHGDVSPRNMIVSGGDLVLTDYDFVVKIGGRIEAPGTVLYSSPSFQEQRLASSSDDFYALAAAFFHVLYERPPFQSGSIRAKEQGLDWSDLDRNLFPGVTRFLDAATHPDFRKRCISRSEALRALSDQECMPFRDIGLTRSVPTIQHSGHDSSELDLREEHVEWLRSLLQSYPGSRWGNQETRGLDTDFADQTYVETKLEATLERDVRARRTRLVVLCGNAGDGKTALLQHLGRRLNLGRHSSADRIFQGQLPDGLIIRMNLDGSAAWQGRSADGILDEFLAPFHQGEPKEDIVHLLAINDGRLLEWIDGVESRLGGAETVLTAELHALLKHEAITPGAHIRFISLNQRSLVGGITSDGKEIDTEFLGHLVDQLYAGEEASKTWAPCSSCSAKDRCEVFRAARVFGPNGLPDLADDAVRTRARSRLFDALQAVQLRGETHITIRELRAALVYILFGIHYCQDFHGEFEGPKPLPYWDRTFDASSPGRQGELLRELARFDPALEAHPQIDRHLLSVPSPESTRMAPTYAHLQLASARRRALFEWTTEHIQQVASDHLALDLARGRHLRLFRNLPLQCDPQDQAKLCESLCAGISRLEDLPPQALSRPGVVPLRLTPRTPTETAFWVEKPIGAFRVEADLPPKAEGVERLHRQAFLIYRYRRGGEERLRLGAELFHLLLELGDGYQLGDVSTDDTFANLSLFVRRLVREDERELMAWNPMRDDAVYQVSAVMLDGGSEGIKQTMRLREIASGGEK